MDVQFVLNKSLEEGHVRELYLYQTPVLKTCSDWGAVKEVGKINFKGKHANYNGALVRYADVIYFVPDARIEALSAYRKWDLKRKINVVTEADHAKTKKKK